jgi:hypothetical protein
MRDDSLDEFEAIFEQASIPVFDIEEVVLARVSIVLSGAAIDASLLKLGAYMKKRFGSEIRVHLAASAGDSLTLDDGYAVDLQRFTSTAELVGQISIGRGQLVLLSDTNDSSFDLDTIVEGTSPPVLIVRSPLDDPATLFRGICHSLTGNFRQSKNFSYSFALAEDGSHLELLHVIDESEVEDVRDALLISPDIAEGTGESLLENLRHHGERYLKGVVAASRSCPFDVSYRLAVGDLVDEVRGALARGDFGLLVVGVHHEGHSHITAVEYQLMHQIRDIAVLAL